MGARWATVAAFGARWAIVAALAASAFGDARAQSSATEVDVYYFWREGCRHCAAQRPLMDRLDRRPDVRVHAHEVVRNPTSRALFLEMTEALGFEARGVPVTIIGQRHWVGFRPAMEAELERAIEACLASSCPDPLASPGRSTDAPDGARGATEPTEAGGGSLTIPWIGEVDLRGRSLFLSTVIIAFVDGFNPCSLWVLTILLSLVLNVGSRRRIVLVGLTFLGVTALVYGLFIAGLFQVFTLVAWIDGARIAVALLALVFAVVNIKDYFWFQKGVSFTISDEHKPKIYKRIRAILSSRESGWAMVAATAAMALGVSLMEMPCTAGFPILWTNMVAAHDVGGGEFALLLTIYMLIYLLDELVVFGTVAITLRASKMQDKHGRVLKLIGGGVMLALAIALLVRPELMDGFTGSLIVFGAAFAGVGLVLLLHRVVLPRMGLFIGSERRPKKRR